MYRKFVFTAAAVVFFAVTIMTISSIIIPRWISWNTDTPSGTHIHYTYGLHARCTSMPKHCDRFPQRDFCQLDRYFCSMWRSIGFLMSFAVVMEGMTLITFVVLIAGGKQKREAGWKILTGLLVLVALIQCTAMALVAYLYDSDDRFFPGWKLDTSWTLCTVSWTVTTLLAGIVSSAALFLPQEGGYELIPDYNP